MASEAALSVRLERHVHVLSEVIGERNVFRPQALGDAAEYIDEQWRKLGFEVTRQIYEVEEVPCANLEITCTGQRDAEGILLLGAHYDTVFGSPGANDNASGVAALIEMARHARDNHADRTLRFVAFVNEEPPFFFTRRQGSMVYARAARARGDAIRLMVSLEMLGCYSDAPGSQSYPPLFRYFYPDRGNFIALVSNLRSRRALKRFAAAFRRQCAFPVEDAATPGWIPGVAWSDHRSFWRCGYPALMVTDTAFYRYPHYHAPSDTADKLDFGRMAEVTEGLSRTVSALASER